MTSCAPSPSLPAPYSPLYPRLLRVLSAFNCSTRRAAGGAHHVQRVSVSLWLLFAARANCHFFVNFPQVLLQVLLDGPPSAKLAAGFAGLRLAGFASFLACFSLTSSLRRRRSSRRRLSRQWRLSRAPCGRGSWRRGDRREPAMRGSRGGKENPQPRVPADEDIPTKISARAKLRRHNI